MFLMLIPTFFVMPMMVFDASACATVASMRSETGCPKLQATSVKSVSDPSSIVMRMGRSPSGSARERGGDRGEPCVGVVRSAVVHGGVDDEVRKSQRRTSIRRLLWGAYRSGRVSI